MPKRAADNLIAHPYSDGAVALLVNAMTTASEPKKLRLDPLAFPNCLNPATSQLNVPAPASQSATTAATIAQNALLNFAASGATTLPSSDPSGNPMSRVVHLRNIPSDMSELELIHFCLPFGKLSNYLMLKGKNQAFVEYEDESCAQAIVHIAHACPMAIRGKTIFCQYSTHRELKTERKLPTKSGAILGDMVLPPSNLLVLGGATTPTGQSGNVVGCPSGGAGGSGTAGSGTPCSNSASQLDISTSTQQQPNSVLRVIVENMIYPVTLEVLHTIFGRFGKVLRIITFSKNRKQFAGYILEMHLDTFQSLVQFSEANAAQNARNTLDGQNLYSGACMLRIDYSKLSTLNVKYNNDKSRDYTNPMLPAGELSFEQQLTLAAQNPLNTLVPNVFSLAGASANGVSTPFYSQSQSLNDTLATNQALATHANSLAPFLGGLGGNLAALVAATNGSNGVAGPSLSAAAQTILHQQLGSLLNSTPVVLVSNLDEKKVTPDALFTLFGVYGDVQRVKILFNKKDNALIQYAEPQQAQLALQHLDKIRWNDKVVRVAASKHTNVQMPKEGQPDAGLTRDYTNSPLHRFKKPGSKNYMNIYPPSATLHLSNIPPNITVEFMKNAFEENGFSVKDFQFFQRDHKMALVQLADVETAIEALVVMHNYRLADNAHLRVSFSKKGLKV